MIDYEVMLFHAWEIHFEQGRVIKSQVVTYRALFEDNLLLFAIHINAQKLFLFFEMVNKIQNSTPPPSFVNDEFFGDNLRFRHVQYLIK